MKVLAIIPARGGSKGLPGKNLADLCGKPLIAHSIEVALAAESISRVMISTDDPQIAAVARDFGGEVPFMRPAHLANDDASPALAIGHMLQWLRVNQSYTPDAVVALFPTHPLRTPRLVESLTRKLTIHQTVVTARSVEVRPLRYFQAGANGLALPLTINNAVQTGPSRYYRCYGVFSAWRVGDLEGSGRYVHPLNNPIETIDIDTEEDLQLARQVIREGLFDFTHGVRHVPRPRVHFLPGPESGSEDGPLLPPGGSPGWRDDAALGIAP